jgi:hypothetical protein
MVDLGLLCKKILTYLNLVDDQIDYKINSNFNNISDKFKDTAKSMYSIFE